MRRVTDGIVFFTFTDDGSFPKPVGECGARALRRCDAIPKENKLLYVGRMMEAKGQLKFLERADAEVTGQLCISYHFSAAGPYYAHTVRVAAGRCGI